MKILSIRAIAVFLAIFISGVFSQAQDITGQWNGVLNEFKLRLVFHITQTDDGYTATWDSPDQNATGMRVTTVTFDGAKLSLAISNAGILYEGEYKADTIAGTFKQGGMSFPMTLKRTLVEVKSIVRPQEPKPPFPYRAEDITFENKIDGITLAGTLTLPETGSNFTAVILITGSGPQNRDEEIMGHKPFLVIADYLTRRGIAVLRYDDRGTAQSTGNFARATTADFATDAESAIAYLKTRNEINPQKIGLMGHSEGGVIAPMIAARSEDVGFIVMLAGTGIRGDKLGLMQQELLNRAVGTSEAEIAALSKITAKVFDKILTANGIVPYQEIVDFLTTMKDDIAAASSKEVSIDDFIKLFAARMNPWMQYFLRYDPALALEQVKCPVLAINGSMDLQVPAKENLAAIAEALKKGGNQKVTIKEYPGLNHLFQECTTGSMDEYAIIEQTFSPEVLKDLGDWILAH